MSFLRSTQFGDGDKYYQDTIFRESANHSFKAIHLPMRQKLNAAGHSSGTSRICKVNQNIHYNNRHTITNN